MNGKLTGVGVGPGDPQLLTVKAVRLIQDAPVLAYAVDAAGRSYARQIAAEYIRSGQEELPLRFSMSPREGERREARRKAVENVLAVLRRGCDVVYITEGDPLVYSTFQHLLAGLPGEIRVEVCPGISAMAAAAAAARFPLAREGQRLIVATPQVAHSHISEWLRQGHSVVLYKPGRQLPGIIREINSAGFNCEAVLVENVSTHDEVILRSIDAWRGREAPYFSVVLLRPRCIDEKPG